MYPVLFRLGEFEVSGFGVMVALGALVGLWLFRRELDRSGLAADGVDAALIGVIGGLLGAKLLYVAEHLGEEPVSGLLFARAGLSWYGGFAGGLGAGLLTFTVKHLPVVPVLAAATPALALGHAIGRIGCLLVGDDYGRATDLPWGMAFPQRVALDLTVAQWASLLVVSAGLLLVVAPAIRDRAAALHADRAGSHAGIPPPENRLKTAVRAGERLLSRHGSKTGAAAQDIGDQLLLESGDPKYTFK